MVNEDLKRVQRLSYSLINKLSNDFYDLSKFKIDDNLFEVMEKELLKIEKEEDLQQNILRISFEQMRKIFGSNFGFDHRDIFDYGNCYVVKFFYELYDQFTFIFSKDGSLLKYYSHDDCGFECEGEYLKREINGINGKVKVLKKEGDV